LEEKNKSYFRMPEGYGEGVASNPNDNALCSPTMTNTYNVVEKERPPELVKTVPSYGCGEVTNDSNPKYYNTMAVQPIRLMQLVLTDEEFVGYLKGNMIKYAMRANRKEGSDDKAKFYQYNEWKEQFELTGDISVKGESKSGSTCPPRV
jgi:hypothetical protein